MVIFLSIFFYLAILYLGIFAPKVTFAIKLEKEYSKLLGYNNSTTIYKFLKYSVPPISNIAICSYLNLLKLRTITIIVNTITFIGILNLIVMRTFFNSSGWYTVITIILNILLLIALYALEVLTSYESLKSIELNSLKIFCLIPPIAFMLCDKYTITYFKYRGDEISNRFCN